MLLTFNSDRTVNTHTHENLTTWHISNAYLATVSINLKCFNYHEEIFLAGNSLIQIKCNYIWIKYFQQESFPIKYFIHNIFPKLLNLNKMQIWWVVLYSVNKFHIRYVSCTSNMNRSLYLFAILSTIGVNYIYWFEFIYLSKPTEIQSDRNRMVLI